VPGDGKNPEGWSSEDKFAVVLETAPLNAAELAEYCHRGGFADSLTRLLRCALLRVSTEEWGCVDRCDIRWDKIFN
jgi:hypothetical protein